MLGAGGLDRGRRSLRRRRRAVGVVVGSRRVLGVRHRGGLSMCMPVGVVVRARCRKHHARGTHDEQGRESARHDGPRASPLSVPGDRVGHTAAVTTPISSTAHSASTAPTVSISPPAIPNGRPNSRLHAHAPTATTLRIAPASNRVRVGRTSTATANAACSQATRPKATARSVDASAWAGIIAKWIAAAPADPMTRMAVRRGPGRAHG